jgi:hypothetical protein
VQPRRKPKPAAANPPPKPTGPTHKFSDIPTMPASDLKHNGGFGVVKYGDMKNIPVPKAKKTTKPKKIKIVKHPEGFYKDPNGIVHPVGHTSYVKR